MNDASSPDIQRQAEDVREENARLKKDLEDMEWASRKTNEGIKILYKDLERKNEELKKLDVLKSKFVSTVSHELRTPLTIMIQTIENFVAGAFGEVTEQQRLWLGRVGENADHLKGLLNEILDLSKLQSNKTNGEFEYFDLTRLVRSVMEDMRLLAEPHGIKFTLRAGRDLPRVWGCQRRLVQVMTNLIANALKFTPFQGQIDVTIEKNREFIRVAVCDTGPGLKSTDLEMIFDPFVQADGPLQNDSTKGIGLGLTICREIICQHQGKIWAESELDKGSRFIFTLPTEPARSSKKEE